jgi:histidinol-phosphatase (PHP family)
METDMSILSDYHMHTHHSGDSTAPMEDMIKSSIDRGLEEICFTEHVDFDYPEIYDGVNKDTFTINTQDYREEVFRNREKYKDSIHIGYGIEIGMQEYLAKENSDYIKENNFDFVIASQHLVDRTDPYYASFWEGKKVEDLYNRYFDQIYDNINLFDDFDVLGHLDYLTRYAPEGDTTYSYERFSYRIDKILIYLIENGKGLDFNSKVFGGGNELPPNPCPEVLRRFKELGGKIITIGSDAHSPGKVAIGFDRMREIALECGFTEYYTYKNRIPTPHSL